MKLYAIRDRLLDYYLRPFIAHSDKQVLADLATTINEEGMTHVIAKAPHHFELWQLAIVDEETGEVTAERTLIQDCSSLIRTDLRKGGSVAGDTPGEQPPPRRQGAPSGNRDHADTQGAIAPNAAQAAPDAPTRANPRPGGVSEDTH